MGLLRTAMWLLPVLLVFLCVDTHAMDDELTLEELLDLDLEDVLFTSKRANTKLIKNLHNEAKMINHTAAEKRQIVDRHNEFRSQVDQGASNMEYMTWNEELAYLAGLWATICYPHHGFPKHKLKKKYAPIGQNIWIGGGKADDDHPNGRGAVSAWHNNEAPNYDITSKRTCTKGTVCGHYTQVVWATSSEVGCSTAFCPTTIDNVGNPGDLKNIWIEVCHYAPSGNFKGMRPYKRGPSCTKCASGIGQCYNNMCRPCSDHNGECVCKADCQNCSEFDEDSCTCSCKPGWHGPDCSYECKDYSNKCGKKWRDCTKVEAYCPLMCNACEYAWGSSEECVQ